MNEKLKRWFSGIRIVNQVNLKRADSPFGARGSVPEWNTYYPTLDSATNEQRKFFHDWSVLVRKGRAPDIEGNLSYAYVLLYEIIEAFLKDKNLGRLLDRFDKVTDACSHYDKILESIGFWTGDAYLLLGDYDTAWDFLKTRFIRVTDVLNIRSKCRQTSIDGEVLSRVLGKSGRRLTKFGRSHEEQVTELTTVLLNEFHRQHGKNLVEHFCDQYDLWNLTEDDFSALRESYNNEDDFLLWKTSYLSNRKKKQGTFGHCLFPGVPFQTIFLDRTLTFLSVPHIVEGAVLNEGRRIVREAENTLREEMDLPKVGEGWIAETKLFQKVREAFPAEKVIHHGRPSWLGRHHIDIYFPHRAIGLEYQGVQHHSPVEYFGGEEAFKKQQARDKKKARLCKKNGCHLIYVQEGYDFTDVKTSIRESLSDSKESLDA